MTSLLKISKNKLKKIKMFTLTIIESKSKEKDFQYDHNTLYKIFYNRLLGEIALEEYLGVEFIDWTIGPSSLYNRTDLQDVGLNIGVKSVENNKFPLVRKNPISGEIINIILNKNTVMIGGYATILDLLLFSSDKYVLSPSVIKKGLKTAFYGLDMLQPFYDIKSLKELDNHYFNRLYQAKKYRRVV